MRTKRLEKASFFWPRIGHPIKPRKLTIFAIYVAADTTPNQINPVSRSFCGAAS
jgi:hypothetical protein